MKSRKPHQHPHCHHHPNTFRSGGNVNVRQTGAHFHAETVSTTQGEFDITQPHCLTFSEQNALVWLVYRNRQKFKIAKPNEPLVLCVADIDLTLCKFDKLEENLGSDSVTLMRKIYRLVPLEEKDKDSAALFEAVNELPTIEEKLSALNQQSILNNPTLATYLQNFRNQNYVKKAYLIFLLPPHVRLLEQLYDELFKVHNRKQKGVANFTNCVKVKHEHFPKLTAKADETTITQATTILDQISTAVPDACIVFNKPKKQSKGGWQVWSTNQNDTYAATLLAKANNNITGNKVIEAMELVFNSMGLKAQRKFQGDVQLPAVVVAFTEQQLRTLNIEKTKRLLAEKVKHYSTPLDQNHVAKVLKK